MTDLDAPTLTPVDDRGRSAYLDAGRPSNRTAVATGRVRLGDVAYQRIVEQTVPKGDVLTVARIAGIMGAKQTSRLLPFCQDVFLQHIEIDLALNAEARALDITALIKTQGVTGVEMEALTAVSMAALAVYDMCKSVSKDLAITDIHLRAKTGGQSGDFRRSGRE